MLCLRRIQATSPPRRARPTQYQSHLLPAAEVTLSDVQLKVTAVGDVANENFKNLGHLVLKLDAATEAALPGDVSCSFDKKPEIEVGDKVIIKE